jgi:hypothetical protein
MDRAQLRLSGAAAVSDLAPDKPTRPDRNRDLSPGTPERVTEQLAYQQFDVKPAR